MLSTADILNIIRLVELDLQQIYADLNSDVIHLLETSLAHQNSINTSTNSTFIVSGADGS